MCAIVVNYCSCVLNKIMPPKGGSERSELTPCSYYNNNIVFTLPDMQEDIGNRAKRNEFEHADCWKEALST